MRKQNLRSYTVFIFLCSHLKAEYLPIIITYICDAVFIAQKKFFFCTGFPNFTFVRIDKCNAQQEVFKFKVSSVVFETKI